MQYIAHKFNDSTIRFVLRYPGILPPDLVKAAARHMVYSADILHAAFVPERIGGHWQVYEDVPECAYFTLDAAQGDPLPLAIEKSLQSVPLSGPAQMQVHLEQGERQCAVAVCLSHLCVDGGDGCYLLETFCACCREMLEKGTCSAVRVKNGRRDPEQMYEHLDRGTRRLLCKSPMTGVKSLFPFGKEDPCTPCMLKKTIAPREMLLLRDKARRRDVTVNDVLIAACYHALASLPGMDPRGALSLMSMMDLRRLCPQGQSAGLCNLAGSLPTVLHEGISDDFDDTLCRVAAQTKAHKKDALAGLAGLPLLHAAVRRLPTRLLLKAADRIYSQMAVGMTNLGNLQGDKLQCGGMLPDAMVFGGPLKKRPNAQMAVASLDGACTLSVTGSYGESDRVLLQRWLDETAAHAVRWAQQ